MQAMAQRERPPHEWRHLAVECFYACQERMCDAVRLFRQKTGNKCMTRPEAFITRWVTASKKGRSLHKDAPRSGRPCTVNDTLANLAADRLTDGFQQNASKQRLQYTSIREALSKDAVLKQLQQIKGVHDKTMIRSMKRVRPALCQRVEKFHQPLSDTQMSARFLASKKMIRKPRHYLRRTIWLDAAKFWVDLGKGRKVWVDRSKPQSNLEPVDTRAKGKRGPIICLAYYAAVNEELGPVYIKLTSGTRGYKGNLLKSFTVWFFSFHK